MTFAVHIRGAEDVEVDTYPDDGLSVSTPDELRALLSATFINTGPEPRS